MKVAVLVICILFLVPSTHAQGDVSIAPCFKNTERIDYMRADGIRDEWVQVFKHNEHLDFLQLEGQQIVWLGYDDKNPQNEWYGIIAGFKGINMFNYGDTFVLSFFDKNNKRIGRAEIVEYGKGEYIIYVTTTYEFGRSDRSRYAYHIPSDPRGGACMFRVDKDELDEVLGWQ